MTIVRMSLTPRSGRPLARPTPLPHSATRTKSHHLPEAPSRLRSYLLRRGPRRPVLKEPDASVRLRSLVPGLVLQGQTVRLGSCHASDDDRRGEDACEGGADGEGD